MHPLTLRPGMAVGPWRIVAPLGSGAFGIVFQVEHAGRLHALKFALRGPGSDDLNRTDARAARELACLLQAVHPNVARVWAHGRWPDARTGYHYVVMDFVEGATLDAWVKHVHPPPRRVARLFARLARTLGELHARDVFHRDLKPSNILVRDADDEPVLVDFGSADHAEALPLTEGVLPPGTPQYRSPEALRFQREHYDRPDARYPFRATDDLYALGVTLYEVVTGTSAFSPTLPRDVLFEHIEERLPPLPTRVNPRVPEALEAIILRLLRKRARERFPHGEALHAALDEALRTAGPEWDEPLFPGAGTPPAKQVRPSRLEVKPTASVQDASTGAPRSRAWRLLGVGVLLALLVGLGWKRLGAAHAPARPQAPVPTATPLSEHPRRDRPCAPAALRDMDEVLRAFRGTYHLPLTGTVQLDFHQDYAGGDALVGGLRSGAISSIVRNPGALPSGTVLHGWAWVEGADAEIQWFEADIPRHGQEPAHRITLCARAGNAHRRTVRLAPGSTAESPLWLRLDEYVLVERW